MIHHFTRATRHVIFWSLMVIALGITGIRLTLIGVETFKSDLATRIGKELGAVIDIGSLSARMRRFSPELIIKDVRVRSTEQSVSSVISLKELRLGINLSQLLINKQLASSAWISFVGAHFTVQQNAQKNWQIRGLASGKSPPLWLFDVGKIALLDSHIEAQWGEHAITIKQLPKVNVVVINQADQHKIKLLTELPDSYGKQLSIAAVFKGNPLLNPAQLSGKIYVHGQHLQAELLQLLPVTAFQQLTQGTGEVSVWGHWQAAEVVAVTMQTQWHDLAWQPSVNTIRPLNSLDTQWHWQRQPPSTGQAGWHWQMAMQRCLLTVLDAQQQPINLPNIRFVMQGGGAEYAKLETLSLMLPQLDMQAVTALSPVLATLLPTAQQAWVGSELSGQLSNVAFNVDQSKKTLQLNADFAGLTLNAIHTQGLALENWTGHIQGTEQQGTLRLASHDATVSVPAVFRQPLLIKALLGSFEWQQTAEQWRITSKPLQLDLRGVQTENAVRLVWQKKAEQPFLDWRMRLQADDVSQLRYYFPHNVIKPVDLEWLDRAFVSGKISQGSLSYYGKLGQLANLSAYYLPEHAVVTKPLRRPELSPDATRHAIVQSVEQQDGAVFEALLQVRELTLDYAPQWPQLNAIEGEVLFLQGRMEVAATHGHSYQLTAHHTKVINEALGKSPRLLVQGQIDGRIADALLFLQATPLNASIGGVIEALIPRGNTQVKVALSLPLAKGLKPKVEGSASLENADLIIKAIDLPIKKVTGLLKFTEQGIFSDPIHANVFKHPTRIIINNKPSLTEVNMAGEVEPQLISQHFGLPEVSLAKGVLHYDLRLVLPETSLPTTSDTPRLAVQIASDLTGVALQLPNGLGKTATEATPLMLSFDLTDTHLLPIEISYTQRFNAHIRYNTATHQLNSGHILIGKGEAKRDVLTGITLELRQEQLNLKEWLMWPHSEDNNAALSFNEIHINSPQASWGNAHLGHLDIRLLPSAKVWSGSIESKFARGTIHIPVPQERITLNLDFLDFSILKNLALADDTAVAHIPTNNNDKPTLPEQWPLLSMTSQQTVWDKVELGTLTIQTQRIPQGLQLSHFELTGLVEKLNLSGRWQHQQNFTKTEIQGHLSVLNAGSLFSQLKLTDDFVETSGKIDFSLHWPAAPYQFSLAALQGEIALRFNEGRILSIEPGMGRALGMLAMAQWLKRLQLDFRDVYQQGLTFNSIQGDFILSEGKASSQNLVIDAIPANISLQGDINLVTKTLEQSVHVAPKGADALPIAGPIMDKLTTVIATTLTGEAQNDFLLGTQYRLFGNWHDVQVQSVHENEGLIPKLGTQMNAFPWLLAPQK